MLNLFAKYFTLRFFFSRCITLTKLIRLFKEVLPTQETSQMRLSIKERQLIIMLLSQIFITVICQIPSSIYQLYAVITLNYVKSQTTQIIEFFIYNTAVVFLFLPACLSFYVYFVTTKTFRNEFKNTVKKIVHLQQ